jgi:hypothetical protein
MYGAYDRKFLYNNTAVDGFDKHYTGHQHEII